MLWSGVELNGTKFYNTLNLLQVWSVLNVITYQTKTK